MRRTLTLLAAALALAIASQASAQQSAAQLSAGVDPAVSKKLHDLGYPADLQSAVQRWRSDNGGTGAGPLRAEEAAAILAQPQPEFMGAMVGNPFTGMGVAMRHATRAEAEAEAIDICKHEGGGDACVNPTVVRAEQCAVVVGYNVTIDRRPTYRLSVAISTDSQRALDHAKEACRNGATHPGQCQPLLRFCGDGREVTMFKDAPQPASKTAAAR